MNATRQTLAYLLIVLISIVSSVLITNYSDSRNAALAVRLENARHVALVKVCESNVRDRLTLIKTARVDAKANEAVANDPTTHASARAIRREQAKTERQAIAELVKRLDKKHGGQVTCDYVK